MSGTSESVGGQKEVVSIVEDDPGEEERTWKIMRVFKTREKSGRSGSVIVRNKVDYQAFLGVLLDLIVDLLGLIIKSFDNQIES